MYVQGNIYKHVVTFTNMPRQYNIIFNHREVMKLDLNVRHKKIIIEGSTNQA
jgi:hypothetical protein